MSTLVLPQSMVADRDAGIKANAQHVDDNFNALASAVNGKLDLDGSSTPTADITMGNHKLTNVATPTLAGDATTKGYVDSALLLKANLASPTFTGTPAAPTVGSVADNSTKLATTAFVTSVLSTLYPVGSIYIGTQGSCPLATLIPGSTWQKIEGRYLLASGTLYGTSETYSAGSSVSAGLPNITGSFFTEIATSVASGCFSVGTNNTRGAGASGPYNNQVLFNAYSANSVYGSSTTVRPVGYSVNVWRRTA